MPADIAERILIKSTAVVIFGGILYESPPSPGALNPALPAALEQIINKALEKDPKLRYQSAADLLADLNRLKRECDSGRKLPERSAERARIPSLAVLHFADMSPGKDNEYFSDGLAEEIINAVTRLPGLRVAARTSSFSFHGEKVDVREIGTKLNIEHVLEGSVRKAGSRVRITAQLIGIADGYHLWSERYDREMTDIFTIQDEISQAIAEKLSIQLSGKRPTVKRYTGNVEAYNLYLKGSHHISKVTPESMAKGRQYLEQAIALDRNYAQAWSALAAYYCYLGNMGYEQPKAANEQAGKAARKALELDEMLAEGHEIMAMLRAGEYDWKGAEHEFRRALELDPESADIATHYHHYYLTPIGRPSEAVAATRKLLERDPLSPFLQWRLGFLFYLTRQWDRAVEQFRNALVIDPHYYLAHTSLGVTYLLMQRMDDGLRSMERAAQIAGSNPSSLGSLIVVHALAGRREEARKLFDELMELARNTYVSPRMLGMAYLCFGETDRCFDLLEKAIEEHDGLITHLCVDPMYDSLRSHPRYRALLRRMDLEP